MKKKKKKITKKKIVKTKIITNEELNELIDMGINKVELLNMTLNEILILYGQLKRDDNINKLLE